MHLHASDDGSLRIELAVSEAQAATERGEKFRPTHLMERVSRYVEATRRNRRAIVDDCQGKHIHLRAAIDCLVEDGWMLSEGRGYRVVTPTGSLWISRQRSARPTRPSASPGRARDAADNPREQGAPPRPGHIAGTRGAPRGRGTNRTTHQPPTASPVDNPSLPYVDDGPF